MSNRKKERMDAIERRLAWLEERIAGEAPEDSAPDWLGEHGWYRTHQPLNGSDGQWWETISPLGTKVSAVQDQAVKQQQEWNAKADPPEFSCGPQFEPDDDRFIRLGQVAEAVVPLLYVPDDVRERVRERSDLVDATADTRQTLPPEAVEWRRHAHRYEESLRVLLERFLLSSEPSAPDTYALILGVLEGGTITREGLQRAE